MVYQGIRAKAAIPFFSASGCVLECRLRGNDNVGLFSEKAGSSSFGSSEGSLWAMTGDFSVKFFQTSVGKSRKLAVGAFGAAFSRENCA